MEPATAQDNASTTASAAAAAAPVSAAPDAAKAPQKSALESAPEAPASSATALDASKDLPPPPATVTPESSVEPIKKRPREEDEEEERAALRRRLEARYVGQKFVDPDHESDGALEVTAVEPRGDGWSILCASGAGEEEAYHLSAASKIDEMIEAFRAPAKPASATPVLERRDFGPPGSTIEVLWEVADDALGEAPKDVWWRAAVVAEIPGGHSLADEGEDSRIPAWTIRYVARPELDEPDEADAAVAFLSPRALLDIAGESVMQWRPFGGDDAAVDITAETEAALAAEGDVVSVRPADAVDATIANVLHDNQGLFNQLPRDQQCALADKVVRAKAAFTAALEAAAAARGGGALSEEDVRGAVEALRQQGGL